MDLLRIQAVAGIGRYKYSRSALQVLNGRTPAQYNMDLLRIQAVAGIGRYKY
jgi:hypothetical protein